MPRIDIPGIGPVEFPDDMSDEDIAAAAARLHAETNTQTASAEQFTPAPRMTRLPTDPSTGGYVENLARGVKDAVTSIPRVVRGMTKINPLDLPGQMVEGVRERVQSYADDPLSTVYNDPLSFLGDAATVTGVGAAATGAARTGAREVARQGARAAAAGANMASKAAPMLTDAAIDMLPGGRLVKGGARMVARAMQRPTRSAPTVAAEAVPSPVAAIDDLVEGYDRYMPNVSPARQPAAAARPKPVGPSLPAEFGPDAAAGPVIRGASGNTVADDAFRKYVSKSEPVATEPKQALLKELMRADEPTGGRLSKAGESILTPEEQATFRNAVGGASTTRKLIPKHAASLQMPYDDPRFPYSLLRAQQRYDAPDVNAILDRIIQQGGRPRVP